MTTIFRHKHKWIAIVITENSITIGNSKLFKYIYFATNDLYYYANNSKCNACVDLLKEDKSQALHCRLQGMARTQYMREQHVSSVCVCDSRGKRNPNSLVQTRQARNKCHAEQRTVICK
jgi:hypothetical protein